MTTQDDLAAATLACRTRTDLLNVIVRTFGCESYLEVGCRKNDTFDAIDCSRKVGVDPVEGGTHRMLSDDYFAQCTDRFDLVFIDGDHHHDQVLADALNALLRLNTGGTLVLHDCSPPDADHEGKRDHKCGTAWRAFAWLREETELVAVVADWDFGSGIVRWGCNADPIVLGRAMDDLTYADFEAHKQDWMHLRDQQGVADWLWEQKQRGTAR